MNTNEHSLHRKQFQVPKSRERPKSAPYLRLKISKRTSKCQVFSSTVAYKPKNWTELARPFGFFNIRSVAKYQTN